MSKESEVTFSVKPSFPVLRSKALAVALYALIGVTLTAAGFASDSAWSLDSSKSTASLYLGSVENPDSVNVGIARVAGRVKLDTNNLNNSVVDLSVYPADEDWGDALNPDSDLPSGYIPDKTDHTFLRFESKRIVQGANGQLHVVADLTLTRVERTATAEPNEAYAGSVYGDAVMHMITRQITLDLPNPDTIVSAGPTSVTIEKQLAVNVSALAHIQREDFEELSRTILETNWPSVVANETCDVPSAIGEDYSGVKCTGEVISAPSLANCHMPAIVGEDYSGAVCEPAAGDLTTIVFHLKLTQEKSSISDTGASGKAAE